MRMNKQIPIVLLAISLAVILNSCVPTERHLRYIDPEIYPFLMEVNRHVIIKPIDYDVGFAYFEDRDKFAAKCFTTNTNKPRAIKFDLVVWQRMTNHQREWLLLHEIGHCSYGLDHDKRRREDDAPLSIMHPEGISGRYVSTQDEMEYYYDVAQRVFDGKDAKKSIPSWVREK